MANRAFLMAHESGRPVIAAQRPETVLAAASYQVPLLWLALFSLADLTSVQMELEDDEGHESLGDVPTLLADRDAALARYHARKAALLAAIPAELHAHFDEWERLLEAAGAPYLQVDLGEIWMMFSEEEFQDHIAGCLAGMDARAGEGWETALGQAGFPPAATGDRYEPEVARFGLRGYQWESPVPWKD